MNKNQKKTQEKISQKKSIIRNDQTFFVVNINN